MMIPQVEERNLKPCMECGWNEDHTAFYMRECEFLHMDNNEEYYCSIRDDVDINHIGNRPKDDMCKYNYTAEELKERIDSGVME